MPALPGTPPEAVVAIDLGGTLIKGALVDEGGSAHRECSRPTPAGSHGSAAVVDALAGLIDELVGAAAAMSTRVVGVGLAAPGLVDSAAGVMVRSANLGWRDVPLAGLVAERCGLDVAMSHDVRMAALAEARVGAARGCPDFLLLTVGTGIGAALVVGGRLEEGAHHRAGEIGHIRVSGGTINCGCGRRGCLETIASCRSIERRLLARDGRRLAVEQIARLAAQGDDVAATVWDEAVSALAEVLETVVMLFDPQMLLIGGGLSAIPGDLFDVLNQRLAAALPWGPAPRIVGAELGPMAGCVGAGLRAWEVRRPGTAPSTVATEVAQPPLEAVG